MSWLKQGVVVVVSCSLIHKIFVLDREFILFLGNSHHEKISGHTNLRLRMNWCTNEIAHVGWLVKCCLVFCTNDGLVLETWRSLSPHGHTTSLLSKHIGWYSAHLPTLDRVGVGDNTFSHLILCAFNCVRSDFIGKERSNNLLDLLEMIGSDFFN